MCLDIHAKFCGAGPRSEGGGGGVAHLLPMLLIQLNLDVSCHVKSKDIKILTTHYQKDSTCRTYSNALTMY